MRAVALPLLAPLVVACGARRAPPAPAFPAPLSVDIAQLTWTESGLEAGLRVRNNASTTLRLERIDWSVGPVEVTGQRIGLSLAPADFVIVMVSHPEPQPALAGPAHVAGTVHIRAAGGIRRAEVFRVATPPAPPEIP